MSPELVLIDPRLAILERARLGEPDDTLVRLQDARPVDRIWPSRRASDDGPSPPVSGVEAAERLLRSAVETGSAPSPSADDRAARRPGRHAVLAAGVCALIGSLVVAVQVIGPRGGTESVDPGSGNGVAGDGAGSTVAPTAPNDSSRASGNAQRSPSRSGRAAP